MTATPLSYLQTEGASAAPLTTLAWGLGLISLVVIGIIGVLLVLAVYRRRSPESRDEHGHFPVRRVGSGLAWIYVGLAISVPVLALCTVWTLAVLARVVGPPAPPPLTIEVTGHQWWWEVRYLDADPARVFTTANEIHVPAGVPVRLRLSSSDVIHSFWVPKLAGKMDLIPGQTNITWLQANVPGDYRGQCGEFCGLQHARMALVVVAETPDNFQRWWDRQLNMPQRVAGTGNGGSADQGSADQGSADQGSAGQVFSARCGVCHTIRGTSAGGIVGPDLSHFGTRSTIAAVTLPNDPSHLAAWIFDPQAFKPGTRMPRVPLSTSERAAVVAYLESRK